MRTPNILRSIAATVIAANLTLALAACTGAASQTAGFGTSPAPAMKLAVMAPITGPASSVGEPQVAFARMALAHFNAEHGTSIELVEVDTELDPAKAATVALRLGEDEGVLAVVGPAGSQEVAAAAPVLAAAGLAMVSPSATRPDLTEQGHANLFRVVPRDDVQGATAARFLADERGARSVYLIDDQSSYGVGLGNAVEEELVARGARVTRASLGQDEVDFSAIVTTIKAARPDAVYLANQLASQAALIARQLQEQGVSTTVMGGDGLMTADFIAGAGGAGEGAYVTFFAPDISAHEPAQPVVDEYRAQYGEIGPFGPPAYVATMVALEAMLRASDGSVPSRAEVLAELARTNEPTSLLGTPISFDQRGDIVGASFFLYQIRDGAFAPTE
jgi:branched-chain amino acid transport system substrate-binding protein